MQRPAIVITILVSAALARAQGVERGNPSWLTKEKLDSIERLGINIQKDLKTKGSYRYGYVASKELRFEKYLCPPGTLVDVSRSITMIRASSEKPCLDQTKKAVINLKLEKDGSALPID